MMKKKYQIKKDLTSDEISLLNSYYALRASDGILVANPLWQTMDEPYYMSIELERHSRALADVLITMGIFIITGVIKP